MSRLASLVLLSISAALLLTWVAAPASSQPQLAGASPMLVDDAPIPDVEVEPLSLSDRLQTSRPFAVPTRDPFAFVSPRIDDTALGGTVEGSAWTTTPEPTTPRVPALMAIVADREPGGDSYRAAVRSTAGQVRLVAAGDTVDGAVVTAIEPDAVVFRDAETAISTRVPLR